MISKGLIITVCSHEYFMLEILTYKVKCWNKRSSITNTKSSRIIKSRSLNFRSGMIAIYFNNGIYPQLLMNSSWVHPPTISKRGGLAIILILVFWHFFTVSLRSVPIMSLWSSNWNIQCTRFHSITWVFHSRRL